MRPDDVASRRANSVVVAEAAEPDLTALALD